MRLADELDGGLIRTALKRLQEYASKYGWAVGVDYEAAVTSILAEVEEGNAYVVQGYLVLVATVYPWYSRLPVLQEWLVLKLENWGTVDSIPPALLTIAKERGCSVVITGDSSPIRIVADAYSNAGFKPLTKSFYKEVP
jgi:hypothetical protein